MHLPSTFVDLLLSLGPIMTAPTFRNWVVLLGGWLFASRRTVTGILVAAGVSGKRHHSAFHRVFSTAVWSLEEIGLSVLRIAMTINPDGEQVFLSLDDTLARKVGRKVFGVGMHHDPLISSRKKKIVNRGHSWVVLAVVVELPFTSGRYFSLPILFRLYRNRHSAGLEHRTRPQLAMQMLETVSSAFPDRRFHVLTDSSYAGKSVAGVLPNNFHLTGRMHFKAQIFARPEPRPNGRPGRPRLRGMKLPSPSELLATTRGRTYHVDLYGRREKLRVTTQLGMWFRVLRQRVVRVVAVEPKSSGRKPQAFYTTDHTVSAKEVLRRYAMRWSIEVAFRNTKQYLGFQQPQGWTRQAVLRTAPTAMLLYSLVVLWFAKRPRKLAIALPLRPWYNLRRGTSFADMLATLKRDALRETLSLKRPQYRHLPKSLETLVVHCAGAA